MNDYEVISTMRKGQDSRVCSCVVKAQNKLMATIKGAHLLELRNPGYEANMTKANKLYYGDFGDPADDLGCGA